MSYSFNAAAEQRMDQYFDQLGALLNNDAQRASFAIYATHPQGRPDDEVTMAKITDHCDVLRRLAEQYPESRQALEVAAGGLVFIESRRLETEFALELARWAGDDEEEPEEAMLERQRAAARAVLAIKH